MTEYFLRSDLIYSPKKFKLIKLILQLLSFPRFLLCFSLNLFSSKIILYITKKVTNPSNASISFCLTFDNTDSVYSKNYF